MLHRKPLASFWSVSLSLALVLEAPGSAAQDPQAAPKYKIEVITAAGKPTKRKKNVISSESVIRVTDQNDVPVAGVTVMFAITQLSGGSAAFTNGAASTIITTDSAGLASTGAVSASPASTFNISVSASAGGQSVTTSIPVNMNTVAAGVSGGGAGGGGAAAGAGAGAGGGISGAMIGVIVAAAAGAAVGIGVGLKGKGNSPAAVTTPTPTPAGIRIGGPGTPVVGAPRP